MSDDATNVVTFAPRPRQAPALQFVELRLIDEDCSLEMSVVDSEGNVVATLAYDLVHCTPIDFDLDLFRAAWDEWRGSSLAAS